MARKLRIRQKQDGGPGARAFSASRSCFGRKRRKPAARIFLGIFRQPSAAFRVYRRACKSPRNPRRDETRRDATRPSGNTFRGSVFAPGGSFNAITRATPGASSSSVVVPLVGTFSPPLPPPGALSFSAALTTTAHTTSSPTNLLYLYLFPTRRLSTRSALLLPSPLPARHPFSPSAAHVVPHYFHFIVSNLG